MSTAAIKGARRVMAVAIVVAGAALTNVLTMALPSSDARAGSETGASQRGHVVFQKWCAPCHGPGDKPGTIALAALYKGAKPALLEERTDLTPELVKHFVRQGVSVMPFFRKTEISDADLDALAAYLTHAK